MRPSRPIGCWAWVKGIALHGVPGSNLVSFTCRRHLVTATIAAVRIAELTVERGEVQGAIESELDCLPARRERRNVSTRSCYRRICAVVSTAIEN